MDDLQDFSSGSGLHCTSRVETSANLCSQRSNYSLQSPDGSSADLNDTESGFESSNSSGATTVTSWRSQRHSQLSQEDSLPDMRNVTLRSTWRNLGAVSVDEAGRGRGGPRMMQDGGSEDEAEAPTTWRAYRATTILDAEETVNSGTGADGNGAEQKGAKPSPAEVRYIPYIHA